MAVLFEISTVAVLRVANAACCTGQGTGSQKQPAALLHGQERAPVSLFALTAAKALASALTLSGVIWMRGRGAVNSVVVGQT
jgi:hypothetical protein